MTASKWPSVFAQWNWKTALLSGAVRTILVVAPCIWGHYHRLDRIFAAEYLYAIVVSGFYGALTQTYCRAEPRALWIPLLLIGIPACNQTLETGMRVLLGAPMGPISLALSFAFTIGATAFSILAMQRGYLTTNGNATARA